ncbi:MAG: hypothetical protein HFE97_00860 [Oscillospiraceae bacterium]|nr:hypothetical protein [Oscillospiraceae bacterium]
MDESQRPPEEPTSPIKRILAWVGVVYMVLLVLLNFYALSQGTYLRGIGSLLVLPGTAGLAVISGYQIKQDSQRGHRMLWGLLAVACLILSILSLKDGLPPLAAQLLGGDM